MSAAKNRQLLLAIVATDSTFARTVVRGEPAWVGKCIHCNARLVIGLDGRSDGAASIEHIVPHTHGGDDDLRNLAIAIEALRARRLARWREGVAG